MPKTVDLSCKPCAESRESSFVVEEEIYPHAFALYNQGNYVQAGALFSQLVLQNPFDEKLWRGLAASKQMEREYEAALCAWALVAILQENDPLPHFHAAECYLSLHDAEEAMKALDAAEAQVQLAPKCYGDLGERIIHLRGHHA